MDPLPPHDVLAEVLGPADARLRLALDFARARLRHAASKGALLETELRRILSEHLPRSYDVGQGEVLDQRGARTGQIDLILANEHQPFRWAPDEPGVYIIEGVSAAGELKSVLGTKELDDIIAKGSRFKALRTDIPAGATIYSTSGDPSQNQFLEAPPFIGVGVECPIDPVTALNRLTKAAKVPSPEGYPGRPQDPVDAVFFLDRGVALNVGDGTGSLQYKVGDEVRTGWVFYESSSVLAELVLWLYRVMPSWSLPSGSPINGYAPKIVTRPTWLPTVEPDEPEPGEPTSEEPAPT